MHVHLTQRNDLPEGDRIGNLIHATLPSGVSHAACRAVNATSVPRCIDMHCAAPSLRKHRAGACADMQEGQTSTAITSAAYSFSADDGHMSAPRGWQPCTPLTAVFALVAHCAWQASQADTDASRCCQDHARARCQLANATAAVRGNVRVRSDTNKADYDAAAAAATWATHTLALGDGSLPDKVQAAVQSMPEGERAVFVVPRGELNPAEVQLPAGFPAPPSAEQPRCLLHVRMKSFVEVRDMTGDGQVCERRRAGVAVVCTKQLVRWRQSQRAFGLVRCGLAPVAYASTRYDNRVL